MMYELGFCLPSVREQKRIQIHKMGDLTMHSIGFTTTAIKAHGVVQHDNGGLFFPRVVEF